MNASDNKQKPTKIKISFRKNLETVNCHEIGCEAVWVPTKLHIAVQRNRKKKPKKNKLVCPNTTRVGRLGKFVPHASFFIFFPILVAKHQQALNAS